MQRGAAIRGCEREDRTQEEMFWQRQRAAGGAPAAAPVAVATATPLRLPSAFLFVRAGCGSLRLCRHSPGSLHLRLGKEIPRTPAAVDQFWLAALSPLPLSPDPPCRSQLSLSPFAICVPSTELTPPLYCFGRVHFVEEGGVGRCAGCATQPTQPYIRPRFVCFIISSHFCAFAPRYRRRVCSPARPVEVGVATLAGTASSLPRGNNALESRLAVCAPFCLLLDPLDM